MILTIASGKGGTGKTTVAVNFALSVSKSLENKKLQLIDCDVEEPNCHIFLKAENLKIEKIQSFIPLINQEKCNLCLECEKICQFNAILNISSSMMFFKEMCHSCEACKLVCKEKAIEDSFKEIGFIKEARKNNIHFLYGELKIGEAMSPPLIRKLKKKIKKDDELCIIDAPPGTSCPAIASVKESDFVLLVTEPTPFGLNDLILAVESVRLLKIPLGIIINKADLGDNKVEVYAQSQNIPILMKINNNKKIAEAYSRGEDILSVMPDLKREFLTLYEKIKKCCQ